MNLKRPEFKSDTLKRKTSKINNSFPYHKNYLEMVTERLKIPVYDEETGFNSFRAINK
jgi:hypothetical protein